MDRPFLVRSPSTSTLPLAMASAASDRVLKKRAAQSHLSIRSEFSELAMSGVNFGPGEGA
jgi:hypothetical protein